MTLAEYIATMVDILERGDRPAHERLIEIAGVRRARIGLDDEDVVVAFEGGEIQFLSGKETTNGEGWTDSETVLDLLDGHIEVTEAIVLGRLAARAPQDDLDRILAVVDILIDASARLPELRALADGFRLDHPRSSSPVTLTTEDSHERYADEVEMLARLDLLS